MVAMPRDYNFVQTLLWWNQTVLWWNQTKNAFRLLWYESFSACSFALDILLSKFSLNFTVRILESDNDGGSKLLSFRFENPQNSYSALKKSMVLGCIRYSESGTFVCVDLCECWYTRIFYSVKKTPISTLLYSETLYSTFEGLNFPFHYSVIPYSDFLKPQIQGNYSEIRHSDRKPWFPLCSNILT